MDIVALATLVAFGAGLVWRLHAAGVSFFSPGSASDLGRFVKPAMLVVATVAAVAAAMQVIVGRTDARRGHVALSTTLWGTLAAGLLCASGFISWVLAVTPQEVGFYPWTVGTTASASHLVFWAAGSRGAGYQPWFLLETSTGRYDRLPPNRMLGFAFSADGSRAVWIEGSEGEVPGLMPAPARCPRFVIDTLEPEPLRRGDPLVLGAERRRPARGPQHGQPDRHGRHGLGTGGGFGQH